MTKIISINPTSLNFGDVVINQTSDTENIELNNIGTELITVTSMDYPDRFEGKQSKDENYVSTITTFTLGKNFTEGTKYYKAIDGTLTTDDAITGILVGIGQPDGSLMVAIGTKPSLVLLDENNVPLLDENSTRLLD